MFGHGWPFYLLLWAHPTALCPGLLLYGVFMSPLFLLYTLSFVPVSGAYAEPINKAREAAFIQSGAKQEWDVVRKAAEKRVPKPLVYAAYTYRIVNKKELRFKSSKLGTWTIRKDSVQVSWGFSW